jgi:hypothetical protein
MVKIDVQVHFYSQLDEAAFFHWAESIPCVQGVDPVTLFVRSRNISKSDLRDLAALLYRYEARMEQLRQFCNARNEHWFKDKRKFWYKRVFVEA